MLILVKVELNWNEVRADVACDVPICNSEELALALDSLDLSSVTLLVSSLFYDPEAVLLFLIF